MRHFSALIAVTLVAASVACGAGGPKVTLPAVAPQDVEVYMPGEFPAEDYEVLKRIQVRELISVDERDMVADARQQAADLGADGLIIRSLRTTQAGGGLEQTNASRDRKILEALAVYYPSRHPELQEQQQ